MLFLPLVAEVYLHLTQQKVYGSQQSSVVVAVALSCATCCTRCCRTSSATETMHSPTTSGAPAFFAAGGEAEYCFTVRNTRPRFAVFKDLLRQLLLAGVFLLTVGHLPPDHTGCPDPSDSCLHHNTTGDNNCISSTTRPSGPQSCLAWICAPVSVSGHFRPLLFAFVRAAASTHSESQQATGGIAVPAGQYTQQATAVRDSLVTTDTGEPGSSDYAGTGEERVPMLTHEGTPTGLDAPRTGTGQQALFYLAVPEGEGGQLQLNPEILLEQQQNPPLLIVKQLSYRQTDSHPPAHWTAGAGGFPDAEPQQQGATTARSADGSSALDHENHPPQQQLQHLEPTSHPVLIENEPVPNLKDHRISQGHGEPHPSAGAGGPQGTGDSGWDLYSEGDQWRSRRNAGLEMYDRRREATDTVHKYSKPAGRDTPGRTHGRSPRMHEAAVARRHSRICTHEGRDESFPHKRHCKRLEEKIALSSGGKETPGAGGRNVSVSREAEVFSDIAINGEEDGQEGEEAAREALVEERLLRRLLERMGIPPIYQPATPTYASPYQPPSPILPLHPISPTTLATYTMPAVLYQLLKQSQSQDMVFPAVNAAAAQFAGIPQVSPPPEIPPTETQERANIQLPEDIADSSMRRQAKESPGEGRAVQARRRREVAFYRASRGGKKYYAPKIHQGVKRKRKTAFVDVLLDVATAVMVLAAAHAIIYSSPTMRALRRELKSKLEEYGSDTNRKPEPSLPASKRTPAPPGREDDTETGSGIPTYAIGPLTAAISMVVMASLLLDAYSGGAVGGGKIGSTISIL